MTEWTASLVEERLEEAAQTLRRLPFVRVQGYFSLWPCIKQDDADKNDWEAARVRLGPPDAATISRMEVTLTWFQWLTPKENRLVWMKANRARWKDICIFLGRGRTQAWEHWTFALAKLAYYLNEQHNIVPNI